MPDDEVPELDELHEGEDFDGDHGTHDVPEDLLELHVALEAEEAGLL